LKKLLLDLKQQKEIIKKIRSQKGKKKEVETDSINTTNSSINDINSKLDVFNERLLGFSKVMQNSYADVQSNQLLINEVLGLVKKLGERVNSDKKISDQIMIEKMSSCGQSIGIQTDHPNIAYQLTQSNPFGYFPCQYPQTVPVPVVLNPFYQHLLPNQFDMMKSMNKCNPSVNPYMNHLMSSNSTMNSFMSNKRSTNEIDK